MLTVEDKMFKLVVLVSLAICALGSNVSRGRPHVLPQLDGRVVGGEETSISAFPYQLSLMISGSHSCGASLISPRIAVTAAHCVISSPVNSMTVRAGSSLRNSGGVVVKVADLAYHPDFSDSNMQYDAAVLKLAESLSFGPTINAVQLVRETPADGTRAIVSGWGAESFGALSLPVRLRAANVKIVSREVCASGEYDYGSDIKSTMICAAAIGKDSCQCDSGGPLTVDAGLAGIVSWGYGCAKQNYPGVYTDIVAVRQWILETALSFYD